LRHNRKCIILLLYGEKSLISCSIVLLYNIILPCKSREREKENEETVFPCTGAKRRDKARRAVLSGSKVYYQTV